MKNNTLSLKKWFSIKHLRRWLLNDASLYQELSETEKNKIDIFRFTIFILLHIACLALFYVGISWAAVVFALFLYISRMFFITAFYHRYFSHRTYKVSRPMQLLMAIAGCTAGQRGPMWWASHHRGHHINSDTEIDPHSPRNGLFNSHMLWFLRRGNFPIQDERINDFLRYPELRFLEKVDWLPFALLFFGCYFFGELLATHYPGSGTNGAQLMVWGGLISTVVLYHATYSINSLAHLFGKRRFDTEDDSRNNIWLALLTLGEGWHNNHHRYPAATRQGFYRGELDISFYLLSLLAMLGLAKDFKPVPVHILEEGRQS
ncbi:MAG: stearoyl-CoA desaturase (delta-9 desaturase) [Gammaproteobacteria bacterium]|jgi:stearoyl-CoA desaturase (delta-9 desaturase)